MKTFLSALIDAVSASVSNGSGCFGTCFSNEALRRSHIVRDPQAEFMAQRFHKLCRFTGDIESSTENYYGRKLFPVFFGFLAAFWGK